MIKNTLLRYTDLTALFYLLKENSITLLDPQSWDDKNDSNYMSIYKNKLELRSVLAACFSQSQETYHHWRVFANGPAGVCIRFDKSKLIHSINSYELANGEIIRAEPVRYLKLDPNRGLYVDELPFLKRYAFEHEDEFRIIFHSKKSEYSFLDIPINLDCIIKITLSPWINRNLSKHLGSVIKSLCDGNGIQIRRSTLINNQDWLELGMQAKGKKIQNQK